MIYDMNYLNRTIRLFLLFCCFASIHSKSGSFYQHLSWNVNHSHSDNAIQVRVKKNNAPIYRLTPEAIVVAMQSLEQLYGKQYFCSSLPPQEVTPLRFDVISSDVKSHSIVSPNSDEMVVVESQQCVELKNYIPEQVEQLEKHLLQQQQLFEWQSHFSVVQWRVDALDELKKGNQHNFQWHYSISDNVRSYCELYAINIESLELCSGDILQHVIHNEFVVIAQKSANLWRNLHKTKVYHNAMTVMADFIDAGVNLNQEGSFSKALVLADACWMFVDFIQAIGEGFAEGACAIVDDFTHPVRTVKEVVDSAITCGYYLAKALVEVGGLGYSTFVDHEALHNKLVVWTDNFAIISAAIKEKRKTLKIRDVIKQSASFGMQCYATSRVLHGAGRLFSCAQKHAARIAKEMHSSADRVKAFTTPEGIIVRVAQSATEYIKDAQQLSKKQILAVQNMHQFFELPFGELLAKNSIKTPYRYQNPIYKMTKDVSDTKLKKGCFYYLDRLHLDHIEVFNSQHKVVAVYNLDGTFNGTKFKKAYDEKRNIDKLMKGKT